MINFPLTARLWSALTKPRLLPGLIIFILLATGLKLGQIGSDLTRWFHLAAADAQQKPTPSPAASNLPQSLIPAAQSQAKAADTADKAGEAPEKASAFAERDPLSFSKSEIELLQNLSARREALDARARDLETKAAAVAAAAQQVEGKLGELKSMEERLKALLKQREEQDEQNLKSLVKIYENMKPGDAARIFEQLEMAILLDVVERMKEVKIAPILAVMDLKKAKSVTEDLAARRSLSKMPEAAGNSGRPG